jgi:cyclopropane fatty-acyl-phospholipid synthase-like methyltransferase
VTGRADPHFLRTTFDDSSELYDRVRPVAPADVFDDLVELARLVPGALLLEIGCGTGQATLPLAERGFEIVAVELGAGLAELTRRKLARFDGVRIVTSSFEEWDPGGERFDAVVSVNAFHWLDPDVRFAKPAAVLQDGGALAIVGMQYVMPDDADPVWVSLQEDYDAVVGPGAREFAPPHPRDAANHSAEIVASGYFRDVAVRRYLWDVAYSADDYIALLETSSWHRRHDPATMQKLFERLHRRIDAAPERRVTAALLGMLYVARRA